MELFFGFGIGLLILCLLFREMKRHQKTADLLIEKTKQMRETQEKCMRLETLIKEQEDALHETNEKLNKAEKNLSREVLGRMKVEAKHKLIEHNMIRLERLNVIGDMAVSIAHEIRNPMTAIRGFLQILQNKGEISQNELLEMMIKETDTINNIIDKYLYLTKNKEVCIEKLSLNTMIMNTMPSLQTEAASLGKSIVLNLAKIPNLYFDQNEIRMLIINLLHNGLEATPQGGHVTIKTFVEKEDVILSVRDQGTGIKSDIIEKIGTPFFTTKSNGTGLGLALCFRIADSYNAVIQVNTNPWGTEFILRFKKPKLLFTPVCCRSSIGKTNAAGPNKGFA